jgi:hypothetical protein
MFSIMFQIAMEVPISPRIIVEGGAYRNMPPDLKEIYKGKTKESARSGYAILMVSTVPPLYGQISYVKVPMKQKFVANMRELLLQL